MRLRFALAASLVVACTTTTPRTSTSPSTSTSTSPSTSTSTSPSPSTSTSTSTTPRVETSVPAAPDTLTSADACTKDDDCLVTNQVTCCTTCPRAPHALSVASHTRNEHLCATVDCMMREGVRCDRVAPAESYRAVCRSGTCAGVKK